MTLSGYKPWGIRYNMNTAMQDWNSFLQSNTIASALAPQNNSALGNNNGYNFNNVNTWGGNVLNTNPQNNTASTSGNKLSANNAMGMLSGILGGVGDLVSTAYDLSQIKDTSGTENSIDDLKNHQWTSKDNANLMNEYSNLMSIDKVNYKDVGKSAGQIAGGIGKATVSGALTGLQVGGPWGALIGGAAGLLSSGTGAIVGGVRANNKVNELNSAIKMAERGSARTFANQSGNIQSNTQMNMLRNYAANGGKLYKRKRNTGLREELYRYSKGKIDTRKKDFIVTQEMINDYLKYLKKSGESNRYLQYHDVKNTVDALNEIAMNKIENNTYNYAAEGGKLTHGGIFDNGFIEVNEGQSHEMNPMEGVQMGVDEQGIPNLVEEGETIFNDYVYSDRLKVPNEFRKKYKLGKNKNITFAEASKKMQRESEERPNDPISKRGLEDSMEKLTMVQEMVRAKNGNKGENRLMAYGGRKYSGKENLFNGVQEALISGYAPFEMNVPTFPNLTGYTDNEIKKMTAPVAYTPSEEPIVSDPSVKPAIKNNTYKNKKPVFKYSPELARYVPAIGAGLGVISDAFGLSNKPDYANADLIANATKNPRTASYNPLGDYMTYTPLDRDYMVNKIQSNAAANRRAILNAASGNRGAAMTGLLTSDYNTQGAIGDALINMNKENFARKQAVMDFNRATNMANSQMGLDASKANMTLNDFRLQSALQQANLRQQADMAASTGRTANLNNLYSNLGKVGQDSYNKIFVKALADSGNYGALNEEMQKAYKARGGKLRKKRKGGYR